MSAKSIFALTFAFISLQFIQPSVAEDIEILPYSPECQAKLDNISNIATEAYQQFDLECPLNPEFLENIAFDATSSKSGADLKAARAANKIERLKKKVRSLEQRLKIRSTASQCKK